MACLAVLCIVGASVFFIYRYQRKLLENNRIHSFLASDFSTQTHYNTAKLRKELLYEGVSASNMELIGKRANEKMAVALKKQETSTTLKVVSPTTVTPMLATAPTPAVGSRFRSFSQQPANRNSMLMSSLKIMSRTSNHGDSAMRPLQISSHQPQTSSGSAATVLNSHSSFKGKPKKNSLAVYQSLRQASQNSVAKKKGPPELYNYNMASATKPPGRERRVRKITKYDG